MQTNAALNAIMVLSLPFWAETLYMGYLIVSHVLDTKVPKYTNSMKSSLSETLLNSNESVNDGGKSSNFESFGMWFY